MRKFFYFRNEADEDDDDAAVDSGMVPVENITGLLPTSTTALTVFWKNQKNENVQDSVVLTITQGKVKKVIASIVSAMNRGPHSDGITIIADDSTTDYDGTARAGVYLDADITACSALSVGQNLRLTAQDLRELNILKYYRLTRKWVCKTYGLKDADLELLIYLDCKERFTRNDFINGVYTYSWDKNRWERLKREGWIETWRHRNRTTIMYSVFKTSFKCSQLISRIYRILLGEEDLPTSERSKFYNNKSYTDKVYNKAIDDMIKDKNR